MNDASKMMNARRLFCASICVAIVFAIGCQNELFSREEEITGPPTSTKDIGAFDPAVNSDIAPKSLDEAVAEATAKGFTPPIYPVRTQISV
ncbi:MAG: hypothetical protein NTY97_02025, partial [Planctomycetota bacterium]|nr:hypothetical protein [Planctomycetota bacterium]